MKTVHVVAFCTLLSLAPAALAHHSFAAVFDGSKTIDVEGVVREFFNSRAGGPFRLEKTLASVPWESGHDGAGAFLLRRA
mgnify:CR=1 FL=1